jgi:tRNA 2-selenouridine synthase
MTLQVTDDTTPWALSRFDVIIDVRSPGEFAEDHVPGAVSMPVLSNEERAEVGTIYVQDDRFKARRIGAAYVARNVAAHLQAFMAGWPGSFQPLVYCWRGGMRSNAMAVILDQVGWRTTVLSGGYRTYRRRVSAGLYEAPPLGNAILLDGPTGSGKTEVLQRLPSLGVQTVDLEGLAAHRGSLFGGLPDRPQPSQKLFESRLLAAIEALDPGRPVVIEAESSKVGERMVPPVLWAGMAGAPRIELTASPQARADYLARTYADVVADPERLTATLERLPERPGPKRREAWLRLAAEGAHVELAAALIEAHYDPAYRRSSRKADRPQLARLEVTLDDAGLDAAARQVAELVSRRA